MLKNNFTGHRKDVEILENYFELFKVMKWPRKILEIGVDKGGSLQLWNDLFAPDLIVGLDNSIMFNVYASYPVQIYHYDQNDTKFDKLNGYTFDLIIDDASHDSDLTWNSLILFWPLLDEGGIYIVEDWPALGLKDFYNKKDRIKRLLKAKKLIRMSNLIAFKK